MIVASIASAGVPVGTGFTYQATLADPGGPVNGVRDLRISLYGSANGGVPIADPLVFDDVAFNDGRVALEIDFGDHFDGSDRWLSIEVRDGAATGDYTVLGPRQRVRANPHTAHAVEADATAVADSAAMAGDADTLDGEHGAHFLAWSNLTGVPPGLDDGDDNTLEGLGCAVPGEVPVWNGGGWECGRDLGSSYAGVTTVGPVGSATANGSALLAAMASIPIPFNRGEAWLLVIEPGLYDLGSATMSMKPWVDVEGGGQNNTIVTSSFCNGLGLDPVGTVNGSIAAELRDLTVENTCTGDIMVGTAIAIPQIATAASIRRVTARALGGLVAGWTIAIDIEGAMATIEDVTAEGTGAFHAGCGIYNRGDRTLILDTTGIGEGNDLAVGLFHFRQTIFGPHVTVNRCSFSASNSGTSRGIWIDSASADLEHVSSTGASSLFVANISGVNTVRAAYLTAGGGIEATVTDGSLSVVVEQSRVWSFDSPTIEADPAVDMRVAATQLWGDPVVGGVICAGVWDETWSFFTNTCP
jgi:hypothetical protein